MDYLIREIKQNECGLLSDFLYEAIYIPEGVDPPDKAIIGKPELSLYIENFGEYPTDYCLVAEIRGKPIGAVWARIMNDYGHIDDDTPSLAIALYKEYRSFGAGTALMREMLSLLKRKGFKKTSLAVQKANYAVKMYLSCGFEVVRENNEEYIMACHL